MAKKGVLDFSVYGSQLTIDQWKKSVGSAVVVNGKGKGTLECVTKKEEELGIVLRDGKGDNDGCKGGKRYFTCAHPHGIFISPSEVMLLEHWNAAMQGLDTKRKTKAGTKSQGKSKKDILSPKARRRSPSFSQSTSATGLGARPHPFLQKSTGRRASFSGKAATKKLMDSTDRRRSSDDFAISQQGSKSGESQDKENKIIVKTSKTNGKIKKKLSWRSKEKEEYAKKNREAVRNRVALEKAAREREDAEMREEIIKASNEQTIKAVQELQDKWAEEDAQLKGDKETDSEEVCHAPETPLKEREWKSQQKQWEEKKAFVASKLQETNTLVKSVKVSRIKNPAVSLPCREAPRTTSLLGETSASVPETLTEIPTKPAMKKGNKFEAIQERLRLAAERAASAVHEFKSFQPTVYNPSSNTTDLVGKALETKGTVPTSMTGSVPFSSHLLVDQDIDEMLPSIPKTDSMASMFSDDALPPSPGHESLPASPMSSPLKSY
eukprot:m.55704 g.55704  ORF g.55704 m.55704 type:complete len:494 (-) comp10999_c0_seq1:1278-2759(-)